MNELIKKGLFGAGLLRINTPTMVDRFCRCLEKVGVKPTKLTDFSIDGMGWSPEVAAEKVDDYYHCHGDTQSVIIISPDQKGKPIYRPRHSFDAAIMHHIFQHAEKQIGDITTRTGMWWEIDKEINVAAEPSDLLMVDSIAIHPHSATGMMQAARDQRDLVREFITSESAWADSEVRKRIIESVKAQGDLRMRSIVINDLHFTDLRSYHTEAFGGVFVIRDLKNEGFMLIFEDQFTFESVGQLRGYYNLNDPDLITRLRKEGLVVVDVDWWKENLPELDALKQFLLIDQLAQRMPEVQDYCDLTAAQVARYAVQLNHSLPTQYAEVERFRSVLVGSAKRKQVPQSLWSYLMRPSDDLPEATKAVIWHLIARLIPIDIRRLFKTDKLFFYQEYEKWSEAKKKWAIKCLTEGIKRKSD